MAIQSVPDVDVAQAAATLAAGAIGAAGTIDTSEATKLGDYALDVFWHIYQAMRVGVELPLQEPSVAVQAPVDQPPIVASG
jgi:hypothetical protein